ncbi:hypothetical protein OH77DRAFT_1522627 [Trametes cingulata]|nr:hypothetical protein OH77DRAFT_1522627 [Trametes cingulata]
MPDALAADSLTAYHRRRVENSCKRRSPRQASPRRLRLSGVSDGRRLLRECNRREPSFRILEANTDMDATCHVLSKNGERWREPIAASRLRYDQQAPRTSRNRGAQQTWNYCLDVVELAVVRKIRAWNTTGPACAQQRMQGD